MVELKVTSTYHGVWILCRQDILMALVSPPSPSPPSPPSPQSPAGDGNGHSVAGRECGSNDSTQS